MGDYDYTYTQTRRFDSDMCTTYQYGDHDDDVRKIFVQREREEKIWGKEKRNDLRWQSHRLVG
jgi:hypothetical protein